MILLDTHAILWLHGGRPRARPLERWTGRLYVSPVNVLELQYLVEVGQLRLPAGRTLRDLVADPRWLVDSPSATDWFDAACDISWTRDVFDRLLVAHAAQRRWRLATADGRILDHLDAGRVVEL